MSHDLHAAWATTEIGRLVRSVPEICFSDPREVTGLTVYAGRESRTKWPIADGVLHVEDGKGDVRSLAIEFKRRNEGLHGILTALGQAQAYLHKGYPGSIIVIPEKYDSHPNPGGHLCEILNKVNKALNIGVFTYSDPDSSATSPFAERIKCVREINLNWLEAEKEAEGFSRRVETQWVHLREGSSDPDAFFRYLQIAKNLTGADDTLVFDLPLELVAAAKRIDATKSAENYLSFSAGNSFHDKVWQFFWFKYVLTKEVATIWNKNSDGHYELFQAPSFLKRSDNKGFKQFFSGRSDSIKNKLISDINGKKLTETEAWEGFARNVHDRAHSYREDIDSGLEHLELLHEDGRPTDLGYRFVDSCERTGNANQGFAKNLLGATILKNGQLGAWLHYVYRLSEKIFKANPLKFTTSEKSSLTFQKDDYLNWIEDELANNLCVMRKVSLRGGARRKPFQAELAILRGFDLVAGFRIGIGLEINWPMVQDLLEIDL